MNRKRIRLEITREQPLAALLHLFGITSNNIHITAEKVLKGYRFKAFEDAWERYLPSLPAGSATKSAFRYRLSP